MNELATLTAVRLRSLFGINKFIHSKDRKEKSRYRMLLIAWIIVGAMMLFYIAALVYSLCEIGMDEAVPAYLVALSSILILAFNLFRSGDIIFGQKGYDILAAMPVKPQSIVISRILYMYVTDLLFAAAVMITGMINYGAFMHPDASFYIYGIIGTLFIPAIPLVISSFFGTALTALTSRMRSKGNFKTVFSVIIIIAVLLFSAKSGELEDMTPDQIGETVGSISAVIEGTYPPSAWIGNAMMGGNIFGLLLFVLVSAALMSVCVLVCTKVFHRVMHALSSVYTRGDYKMVLQSSRGVTRALLVREAKRYFSSTVYVTNTIIGPIMGTIMSVALCAVGIDALAGTFPFDIKPLVPLAFSAVFCMMTVSSTSISMEGKQFWIAKSLPVPAKALLDSKILFNLLLFAPFFVVSEICLNIALGFNIWNVLIPLAVILFSVVWGITVDLKLHNFDWEYEAQIVKQSASAALGGFAGFFVSLVWGISAVLLPDLATPVIFAILIIAVTLLYRKNNKTKLEIL